MSVCKHACVAAIGIAALLVFLCAVVNNNTTAAEPSGKVSVKETDEPGHNFPETLEYRDKFVAEIGARLKPGARLNRS